VQVHSRPASASDDLRGRVLRLNRLPLRPVSARDALNALPNDRDREPIPGPARRKKRSILDLDPGWMQAVSSARSPIDPLTVIAETPWWPASDPARPASEILSRLWRYSVAVSIAARSLASDAGDPDPDSVARAGLLCRLGWWAVAAAEPEWLVRWWNAESPIKARQREVADFGVDLGELGRRLAEKWGCEPLVIDAAWLHGEHGQGLREAASEPDRLAFIQEACRWADQTPWSLGGRLLPEAAVPQHRLRILVAEVQARASGAFAAPDATPHEERATRRNGRLLLSLAAERQARMRADRLLQALADSSPEESPEEWASRAALAWCTEPEISAARVDWVDSEAISKKADEAAAVTNDDGRTRALAAVQPPPTLVLPLEVRGRTRVLVRLWSATNSAELERGLNSSAIKSAWESWAALVSDRAAIDTRLQKVVEAFRRRLETEDTRLAASKLDALSEFAAGAGHELNNPLAVIAGRAQLLLARTEEPETARSLRIMLGQATRAHRILRDLIFVARPPEPRLRACRPSELIRETLRTFEDDCRARQIRVTSEIDDTVPTAWTDPEGLRHLSEILLRNAIEATPAGGTIHVGSCVESGELNWWVSDTGKGINPIEGSHIFDPFFCGRQAGRGLGLGLPRAARIVGQAGGRMKWSSHPGQGTLFQVHLPLTLPPEPIPKQLPEAVGPASNGAATPILQTGPARRADSRIRA
jgi:signal transduction histidine kinase